MRIESRQALAACGLVLSGFLISTSAQAQAPAASAGDSVIVVQKPTYTTIALETTVNKPVADVWRKVGPYCAISEWLQMPKPCTMLSGKEGDVGSVRSVADEIMVAKTEYSYSYTQPVRAGRPYNMYHGTIEARAASPTTTKLLYTLVWDNSMLPDDAAREKDKASRTAVFTRALNNMKVLAEGGTLPPPPPPPTAPGQ